MSPLPAGPLFPKCCALLLLCAAAVTADQTDAEATALKLTPIMNKRFYAWDEMSAKRSLVPPLAGKLLAVEETGDVGPVLASGEAVPLLVQEKRHSGLDLWKRSLRQRRPLLLTRVSLRRK